MRTRDRSSPFRYSPLVAALACALTSQDAAAVTYAVTTSAPSGPGSLADAVAQANTNCGIDAAPLINFNIPGTGPFVISLSASLSFACFSQGASLTIDGSTQLGYTPNTDPNGFNSAVMIQLDGTSIVDPNGILHVDAFPYGSSLTAIGIEARNFTSGGAAISGNVRLRGSHVHSNTFGVDPHGFDATNRAVVGGAGLTARNVIRNNAITGIDVSYGGFVDIVNNLIGLDPAGAAASPNDEGIVLEAVNDVVVQGNYISGNATRGLRVSNTFSSPSVAILGNKIGLTPAGAALGNGSRGVRIESASNVQVINNVIANNQSGVQFVDNGIDSVGVLVSQNSIHSNTDKNIDLDFAGAPLPNDSLDVDTGPNGRQNYPVITGVTQTGGNTNVSWTLNSNATQDYVLEFFSNPAPGTPAGTTFIVQSANQTTDYGGNVSGLQVIPGLFDNISATARNTTTNDTSEFSTAVALTPTPAVTVSPNPLNFPNTVVGASSGPSAITIQSSGTANYVINTFDSAPSCYGGPICASGAFSCSNTCTTGGTGYAPGNSCSVNVTFAPVATGAQTTTFYICDNAPGSPRAITLSGTAIAPPPPALTPGSFDFGGVQVGGFSPYQSFTVTNGSPTPLAIGPFTATGPFQVVAGTCGASVPPSSSCTVDARFAPTVTGPATGTISVGTASGALTSSVTGTGTAPPPTTITPVSNDFGSQQIGTTSANATFTINNPALVSVTLTPLAITGPFAIAANTCGTTLAPNTSCTASANFQPTVVGPASGALSTTANGTSVSAALTGTGAAVPPPSVTVTPLSTNYGNVIVGTTSSPVTFTITNPSTTVPATLSAFSTTGPYTIISTTCTTTLAPSASCTAAVAFAPVAAGAAPGTFVVPSSTGTATANLNGNGVAGLALTVTPGSYDFGSILVGTSSAARTFTITNPNAVNVPISGLATVGPFAITVTSCGASISPSSFCEANVRFTPPGAGTASGALKVNTNPAFGSSSSILTGTGLLQSSLQIPSAIDLGAGTVGGAPIRRIVSLGNGGNAALTLNSITVSPPFTLAHDCPLNLLPGQSCNLTLELLPTTMGDVSGSLVILSNSPGGSRSVPVRASVQARPDPVVKVSPTSIGFGDRMAGTTSGVQRITVTNEGGAQANDVALRVDTPHFRLVSTTCGPTLAPQSTCFADVMFAPLGFGPRRDSLTVTSSDPTGPAIVRLSGAGCRPLSITSSRGGTQVNCAP